MFIKKYYFYSLPTVGLNIFWT